MLAARVPLEARSVYSVGPNGQRLDTAPSVDCAATVAGGVGPAPLSRLQP